jgi:hypothetical protein
LYFRIQNYSHPTWALFHAPFSTIPRINFAPISSFHPSVFAATEWTFASLHTFTHTHTHMHTYNYTYINLFVSFCSWAADQALAIYINSKFFPTAAARFQKFVLRTIVPSLKDALFTLGDSSAAEEYLFPLFAEYCFNQFANEIKSYRELVNSADMTKPHSWFIISFHQLSLLSLTLVFDCIP